MWFRRPKKYHPVRALDEVAEAFHKRKRLQKQRRPIETRDLNHQFELPITPSEWRKIEQALHCELPPLERRTDGLWSFPNGWRSIDDVVQYVSDRHPDWVRPNELSDSAWFEAQIFVRVRACLLNTFAVEKTEIARSSSFINDLGLD